MMPRWCITLLAVACCVLRAALLAVCFGCYPCASPRIGVASVCAVRRFRIVRRVVFVVVHEGGALSAGDYLRVGCCAGGGGGHLAPGRCDASGGLYRPRALNPVGRAGERGRVGAWHASQHASPAVEGALHFELQALHTLPGDHVTGPSPLSPLQESNLHRYSCARSRTATETHLGFEPSLDGF